MEQKRGKRTKAITVAWDDAPRARQGLTIERVVRGHLYSRHVGPEGVLTAPEAARALGVTREFVYRLIWARKLKTVKKSGLVAIPLRSVKEYDVGRRKRRLGSPRTGSGKAARGA